MKQLSKCITITIPFGFVFLPKKMNLQLYKMPNRASTPREREKKENLMSVFSKLFKTDDMESQSDAGPVNKRIFLLERDEKLPSRKK